MPHATRLGEFVCDNPSPSASTLSAHQITRQNLTLWRESGLRALPTQPNMRSVAATIGRPYRQVIDAALRDAGCLADADVPSPRPHDEVFADAIRALTEAARLTNTPMRQTSTGTWEPDLTGTPQPIDWAGFVAVALAGAAANIGGIHRISAGRPGSWEAARVREVWNQRSVSTRNPFGSTGPSALGALACREHPSRPRR